MVNINDSKKVEKNLFEQLEKNGVNVNDQQRKLITDRIESILSYEPRIGVFGKTGVGKSSLCNALFGKDICPISDVEACTRDPKETMLNLSGDKGIKLVDVPGVGESSDRDEEYAKLYAKLLPELDVVLWLLKGDDRAYASDENFYKNIIKPHLDQGKPFFFVLNQVDKIEPFREWNEDKHEPGANQFQNIDRKVQMVASFFDVPSSKIIPVSANEKYNLVKLVDEIVYALPKEKKITVYNQVSEEFQSEATGEHVRQSLGEFVLDKVVDAVDWVLDRLGDIVDACYITTAVCRDSGKPDDCYELTQFRAFRDNWLVNQPDGKKLIKQYYDTAPEIVRKIDRQPDNHEIYQELNEKYLTPCLRYIEDEKYQECKELYSDMVYSLYDRSKYWS